MVNEKRCKSCGSYIDEKLLYCPFCGEEQPMEEAPGPRVKRTMTFREFNESGGDSIEVDVDSDASVVFDGAPATAINKRKRNQTFVVAGIALLVIVGALMFLFLRKTERGYRTACDQVSPEGWVYDIYSDNTAVLKGYQGTLNKLQVPSEIGGYQVTGIESGSWGTPVSLYLPGTIKTIGPNAFSGCATLVDVRIPGSVQRIGSNAFLGTAWFENALKSGVEYVIEGDGVLLAYCGAAKTLELPDNVKSVSSAFAGNDQITSVIINEGVTSIEGGAFSGASNLVYVGIPTTVTEIGPEAFAGTPWLEGMTEEFVVVGDGVMIDYNGGGTSVTVPGNVKYLSDAFAGNQSIASVAIPGTVKVIGEKAFYQCAALEKVNLNGGVTEIKASAFEATGLTALKLPDSVKWLGEKAFYGCSKMKELTLSTALSVIPRDGFYHCIALTNVVVPTGVTSIEEDAFAYCYGLLGVTISENTAFIHENAFRGCGNNVVIYAPAGSYGSDFAQKYGFELVVR